MKTNQFFSIKRFGKYASCSFISNYRQTLLFWGAILFAIIAISLLNMRGNNSNGNRDGWIPIFLTIFYISGLLYSGFAFTAFRSKERTITELMIPVSTFERFLYEFIDKIIVFLLLYPVIFYIARSMAIGIRRLFYSSENYISTARITINKLEAGSNTNFISISGFEPSEFGMFFMLSVLAFVVALAGAATFRKLPLIKTLVFVGLIFLTGIGYFYLLLEKWNLKQPWIASIDHYITALQITQIGTLVFAIIGLIALIYTYFKLKEKEAS